MKTMLYTLLSSKAEYIKLYKKMEFDIHVNIEWNKK